VGGVVVDQFCLAYRYAEIDSSMSSWVRVKEKYLETSILKFEVVPP